MGYLLLLLGIIAFGILVLVVLPTMMGRKESRFDWSQRREHKPRVEKEQMDAPQEEFIDDTPPSAGSSHGTTRA